MAIGAPHRALAGELVVSVPPMCALGSGHPPRSRNCGGETTTIPIVFAIVTNPVDEGFVASLRRPKASPASLDFDPPIEETGDAARQAHPGKRSKCGVV